MKVVAINGSPNKNGNTALAISEVFSQIELHGIECEMVNIGSSEIRGCIACGHCRKTGESCILGGEAYLDACAKMTAADGLILASPVYYSGIAGNMKCFLDRAFYSNSKLLRHKVAASLSVARRSGGMPTFQQLNNYLLYNEMIIATSCYWNTAHGAAPGEVELDEEGMHIFRTLGKNMAWLLKTMDQSKVKPPEIPEIVRTNFIR